MFAHHRAGKMQCFGCFAHDLSNHSKLLLLWAVPSSELQYGLADRRKAFAAVFGTSRVVLGRFLAWSRPWIPKFDYFHTSIFRCVLSFAQRLSNY